MMGTYSRYLGFFAVLVLIILVSGCISTDEVINNNISYNSSVNMSLKTYSADNISFQYPGNWHLVIYDEGGRDIELSKDPYFTFILPNYSGFQLSPSMYSPKLQIQIILNNKIPLYDSGYGTSNSDLISNNQNSIPGDVLIKRGNSINYSDIPKNNDFTEQKIIEMMRNDTDIFGGRISNRTIQIGGKTAYEDVFILNSVFPPMIDRKFVQIVFVKNDKTYLITFEAQSWDYAKERANFDMILNSLQVQ